MVEAWFDIISGQLIGEVPERPIGAVSKTVVALAGYRGFESHPLRREILGEQPGIFVFDPIPK